MTFQASPTTTRINRASISWQLIEDIMKTHEWTPKRRSRALGLLQGGRHAFSEITQITNILKGTLGNLKKCDTPLNKSRSDHLPRLSDCDKCQIVLHITKNHKSRRLSVQSIIQDLQLDIDTTQLKCTLKNLGYHHQIARHCVFLKNINHKH